jgi:hypothetical protein
MSIAPEGYKATVLYEDRHLYLFVVQERHRVAGS